MSKIRNTTQEIEESPLLGMITAMPGGIEASEAAGQRELVSSDQLPVKGSDDPAFAKMGIVMGAPSPGDGLFRSATLPAGWKIQATDHSMWSKLIDEKGRERASIFYKAAFYDRAAHISLVRRFEITSGRDRTGSWRTRRVQYMVMDSGDRVLYSTAASEVDLSEYETVIREKRFECEAWLHERFPQWEDPSAHWDDDTSALAVE